MHSSHTYSLSNMQCKHAVGKDEHIIQICTIHSMEKTTSVAAFVYFVGMTIHEFKIPTKYLFTFSTISYNLKSTNSSVHKHFQLLSDHNFHAHEIK